MCRRQPRQETFDILRKLDEGGRLRLFSALASEPACRSALEGIREDAERDRMILIRVPENSRERKVAKRCRHMPHASLLADLILQPGETLLIFADDL